MLIKPTPTHMRTPTLVESLKAQVTEELAAISRARAEFEREIKAREDRVAKKRIAIEVIEEQTGLLSDATGEQEEIARPIRLVKKLTPDEAEPTFTSKVWDAAHTMKVNITNGSVHDALARADVQMPPNARIQIGTILRRFAERGVLEITTPAGPNTSTVYRVKESA